MTAEPIDITETTEIFVNGHNAACRFCGRHAARGEYRAPGPQGPICTDCLHAGVLVCDDGRERSLGDVRLAQLVATDATACEFCGRSERRRAFLRRRRPLPRVGRAGGDAVICVDCLNLGGRLLDHVLHARQP